MMPLRICMRLVFFSDLQGVNDFWDKKIDTNWFWPALFFSQYLIDLHSSVNHSTWTLCLVLQIWPVPIGCRNTMPSEILLLLGLSEKRRWWPFTSGNAIYWLASYCTKQKDMHINVFECLGSHWMCWKWSCSWPGHRKLMNIIFWEYFRIVMSLGQICHWKVARALWWQLRTLMETLLLLKMMQPILRPEIQNNFSGMKRLTNNQEIIEV